MRFLSYSGALMVLLAGGCSKDKVTKANAGSCPGGCATGLMCSAGACVEACPVGASACTGTAIGDYCANFQSDPNNCGACGNACALGAACNAGVCACGYEDLAVTWFNGCGRKADGTVSCWGVLNAGRGRDGSSFGAGIPEVVAGLTDVAQISGSTSTICARKNDGTVHCYGMNRRANAGGDPGTYPDGFVPTPTAVNITGVADLGPAQRKHFCAAKTDGSVWCWGANGTNNGARRLGNTTAGSEIFDPIQVQIDATPTYLADVSRVSSGWHHNCAVKTDGTVWCWGQGNSGQLGQGANANSEFAVQVSTLTGATAVDPGRNHSCALKGDGTVWCWGEGGDGQLGDGNSAASNVPVQVALDATPTYLTGVTALAVGDYHSCALKGDGTVWCWGDDGMNQQANGTGETDAPFAVQVAGVSGASKVYSSHHHTCAVLPAESTVSCWGNNRKGQLNLFGGGETPKRLVMCK
jgi:alpha-tubulin suppressor-like RCC1 family protein